MSESEYKVTSFSIKTDLLAAVDEACQREDIQECLKTPGRSGRPDVRSKFISIACRMLVERIKETGNLCMN